MNYLGLKRASFLGVTAFLLLQSTVAHAWWNESWKERKPLRIDTSAKGASITEPIGATPVLVRLTPGNFRFDAAKPDGSDIRVIAGDDQTPLAYHIEKYDSLLGEALIWVGIPDLKPGASTEMWLYFGNNEAANAEDKKGTYDPAAVLVYHFADPDKPPQDASTWANHATEPAKNPTDALIGKGLRFDGKNAVTIPTGPALIWAEGGPMTWSAWLRPAKDESTGVVFSRQKDQNSLVIGLDQGKPYVEIRKASDTKRVVATKGLKGQSWSHVAITAGKELALYVDGNPDGKLDIALPALDTRATLGGMAPTDFSAPKNEAGQKEKESAVGFDGDVDELQIAKVERPLGYFRTAVAAQGTDPAKFLTFGQDEEKVTGIGSAYFPIIINSVTFDGWIVIGFLGVMSLISWLVMINKASTIRAALKADQRFQKVFQEQSADLVRLIGSKKASIRLANDKALQNSPLLRIYLVMAEEIRKRTKAIRPLTAENLNAIRATVNARVVHENQFLSNRMVLLTIAISGGPFLGLLGTVIGVMITFAGVAAAGDVNVNAIAPGIAAALVATIAGLAVAIPALFGYNWLLTRIKGVSSTLYVFMDELIAKAAEAFAERAAQGGLTIHQPFLVDELIVESDDTFENDPEDLSGKIASS